MAAPTLHAVPTPPPYRLHGYRTLIAVPAGTFIIDVYDKETGRLLARNHQWTVPSRPTALLWHNVATVCRHWQNAIVRIATAVDRRADFVGQSDSDGGLLLVTVACDADDPDVLNVIDVLGVPYVRHDSKTVWGTPVALHACDVI